MTTTKIENADPLLKIDEAAEYLGQTERWMRRTVEEKRLRYYKLGRTVRFRKSVLDEYIEAHSVDPEG